MDPERSLTRLEDKGLCSLVAEELGVEREREGASLDGKVFRAELSLRFARDKLPPERREFPGEDSDGYWAGVREERLDREMLSIRLGTLLSLEEELRALLGDLLSDDDFSWESPCSEP